MPIISAPTRLFTFASLSAAVSLLTHALPAASAGEAVNVRLGDHPGFGRVVFDFARSVPYRITRSGDVIALAFDGDYVIADAEGSVRNIPAVHGGVSMAEIEIAAGARVSPAWIGEKLVIDVSDAASPAAARPTPATSGAVSGAATHRAGSSGAGRQARGPQARPTQAPVPAAPAPSAVSSPGAPVNAAMRRGPREDEENSSIPDPVRPAAVGNGEAPSTSVASLPGQADGSNMRPTAVSGPMAQRQGRAPELEELPTTGAAQSPLASPVATRGEAVGSVPASVPAVKVSTPDGSAFRLSFGPDVGAAAFQRGWLGVVVFDERRAFDLSALRDDPAFGNVVVHVLPEATMVEMPLPGARALSLTHSPEGWTISVTPQPAKTKSLPMTVDHGTIVLSTRDLGRSVSVPDPAGGGILLVGTQRSTGEAVSAGRLMPGLTLLQSWLGVVVEPLSDEVALIARDRGFLVRGGPKGLALAAPPADVSALADAASMTRRFAFPALSHDVLLQKLQSQLEEAAAEPPQGRARRRVDAAQTMIALGLGAEAQSLLRLAETDDPRLSADPAAGGLSAVAALLAGRPGEADFLEDPRLNGTDEISLWRAIRDAMREETAPSAAVKFAASLPLLRAYPDPLRKRFLPLAAETMASGGQPVSAAKLLSEHRGDPAFALASGMLSAANGDAVSALKTYDALAAGSDRLVRIRAAMLATELRLGTSQLTAEEAAAQLDRLLFAWRGDHREVALRMRLSELRAQAGAWRSSFALLRETEQQWPERRAAIHQRLADLFTEMSRNDGAREIPPLDLAALVDEHADLIPAGPEGDQLNAKLADRLVALDLPRRAAPVLEKLIGSAVSASARATLGASLAELRLREGDPAGAQAALDQSARASDGLSANKAPGNGWAAAEPLPAALSVRRAILSARATAQSGNPNEAAAMLERLGTSEADEARATILETAQQWPQAEQALAAYAARAVPPSGSLTEAQQRIVLREATAAAQAGDPAFLATLAAKEGPRMAGKSADLFRLLTADGINRIGDLPRAGAETKLAHAVAAELRETRASARAP